MQVCLTWGNGGGGERGVGTSTNAPNNCVCYHGNPHTRRSITHNSAVVVKSIMSPYESRLNVHSAPGLLAIGHLAAGIYRTGSPYTHAYLLPSDGFLRPEVIRDAVDDVARRRGREMGAGGRRMREG